MSKNSIIRDFYTYTKTTELQDNSGKQFGVSYASYEIYKQMDVTGLQQTNGFILSLKQRLVIPNDSYTIGGMSRSGYENYLALITNQVTLTPPNGANAKILAYFPKTLNASQIADESSDSTTHTNKTSSGSINTNVNTFGIALDGGFFSEIPASKIALSYSSAWINDHLQESALGKGSHLQDGVTTGLSMSLKDWMAIGRADPSNDSMLWIWAQQYPWNTFLNNAVDNLGNVVLPNWVAQRLIEGSVPLPPSELSLTGVDFTARVAWLIQYPPNIQPDMTQTIQLAHTTTLYKASHSTIAGYLTVKLDSAESAQVANYVTSALDLDTYSLAPVDRSTFINFVTDDFIIAPGIPSSTLFKICSRGNELLAIGTGFDASMAVPNFGATDMANVNLTFKLANRTQDYDLILVHQVSSADPNRTVHLNIDIIINGQQQMQAEVTNFGTSETVFPLRLLADYSNLETHDFLNLGINTINIQVNSLDTTSNNTFSLRSVAIQNAR
jgi:hypothetical protein